MKKLIIIALSACISSTVFANDSFSLGYAQGKFSKVDTLKGLNFKYSHDLDNQWGFITSATYMKGDSKTSTPATATNNRRTTSPKVSILETKKSQYFSLSAGPTYQVNEYIKLYGTLGLGVTNFENTEKQTTIQQQARGVSRTDRTTYIKQRSTSFVYGAGTQINLTPNLLIDLSYEGTSAEYGKKKQKLNAFVLGVGYKF